MLLNKLYTEWINKILCERNNKNPPGLYSGIKAWTIPKQKKIRMKLNSKMINYVGYPLV